MKKSKIKRTLFLARQGKLLTSFFSHFKHKILPRPEKILPRVPLSALVPDEVEEEIIPSENAVLDGNVSPEELQAISRVVKHYQPETLFEIGTFDGRTTVHLALNAGAKAKIYTLDLPAEGINTTALRIKTSDATFIQKEVSGREFLKRDKEKKQITQLFGDSAAFDFAPYEGKIDFVFVDGSHAYEYVYNDTAMALACLRGGKGIIMWHDYGWREVVRALNEMFTSGEELMKGLKHIEGTSLVFLHLN